MSSDSNQTWAIPHPGRKPPPGPEREGWLAAQALYRSQGEINRLLDDISPALRLNDKTKLEQDETALKILEFIEAFNTPNARTDTTIAILRFLHKGFGGYCQRHNLDKIRIPLIQELGLDDGILDGQTLEFLRSHREITRCWIERMKSILSTTVPTADDIVGALLSSSALFGGLPTPKHWRCLVSGLFKPIETDGAILWFDLKEKDWFCRWVADPVSESLLRRFIHQGLLPFKTEMTVSTGLGRELKSFIPESLLANKPHPRSLGHVLVEAAKGVLVQEFPPDIASIALRKYENSPLPAHAWIRLITGKSPITQEALVLNVEPKVHRRFKAELLDPQIWHFIHQIEKEAEWNEKAKRLEGMTDVKKIAERLKHLKKLRLALPTIERDILDYYRSRNSEKNSCFGLVVCKMTADLVSVGGMVKAELAPSTIWSYLSSILRHLHVMAKPDLEEMSADRRAQVYAEAIKLTRGSVRQTLATAIQDFERTLQKHFDMDDEIDWSTVPVHFANRLGTDANLVDPATYQRLLETLDTVTSSHEEFRLLWKSLSVILYRFGLRRGEAHELTLADIEMMPDHRVCIHVPDSLLTTRKTRQSIRTIGPVHCNEAEWLILETLVERKMKEFAQRRVLSDVYLFASPGSGSQLLDSASLFDPITKILHWITGDTTLRIHHFRHGFASRLFAGGRTLMNAMDELFNRSGLWLASFRQDGAWVRAFELGHVAPMESITTYCHTTELICHFYSYQVVARHLPVQFLALLAGRSERTIERNLPRQKTSEPADPIALFLKSVRQKWPLPPSIDLAPPPKGRPAKKITETNFSDAFNPRGIKTPRFADVLDIVRESQLGHFDLTDWEIKGYVPAKLRAWQATIGALIELGIIDGNKRRRDSMPAKLIESGEKLLQSLSAQFAEKPEHFLARCLVGLGHAGRPMTLDLGTTEQIQRWFARADSGITVSTSQNKVGLQNITLSLDEEISAPYVRLFFAVLVVVTLREETLTRDVAPHVGILRK